MINLDNLSAHWDLDYFNEQLPALPYVERPEVIGDDGQ